MGVVREKSLLNFYLSFVRQTAGDGGAGAGDGGAGERGHRWKVGKVLHRKLELVDESKDK